MDAEPISEPTRTQARRLLVAALAVAPTASQLVWLMSNHYSRWPLRLGLPLLGGLLIGWLLSRLHRAACRRWPARHGLLLELAWAAWPLLLTPLAAPLRLFYTEGLIPYLVIAALVAFWLWNTLAAFLPAGLVPRLVRAGTLAVLALGLGWHFLGLATGTGRFDPERENRNPAPMPGFPATFAAVQGWPRAFEQHFDDSFRGRLHLVSFASAVDLLVLNRNFNPLSVVRGEKGWLYRNSNERQLDYGYRWAFTPEQGAAFDAALQDRSAWMREQRQRYLLVLSPDKRSVHPEFIPQYPLVPGRAGKLDQILARVDRLGIDRLDLREPMRESPWKAQGPLFYKHDMHWNLRGAWLADRLIADELRQRYRLPLAPEPPDSAWQWSSEDWIGGDLARFMGNPLLFREAVPIIRPAAGWRARLVQRGGRPGSGPAPVREEPEQDYIETWEVDDPTLPTAVVFHDSSGICLRRFIRERFRRTVLVWAWYCSRELIRQEKPDVVIHLRGEEFADVLARPDVEEYGLPPR